MKFQKTPEPGQILIEIANPPRDLGKDHKDIVATLIDTAATHGTIKRSPSDRQMTQIVIETELSHADEIARLLTEVAGSLDYHGVITVRTASNAVAV